MGTEKLCLQFYSIISSQLFGKFFISLASLTESRESVEFRELTSSNATDLWHVRAYEISTLRLQTNSKLTIDFVVEMDENKEGKTLGLVCPWLENDL